MEYIVFLFEEALRFLADLTWVRFLEVYWPFLIFDCGRYLLADFCTLSLTLWKKADARETAFTAQLRHDPPLVTVIVPAHNEAHSLAGTIASLVEQTHGHLEIIVVDDGSTDGTLALARRLVSGEPRLTVLHNDQRTGKFSVQNLALSFSRGEYVVILDGDSLLQRDAIFQALKKFADPRVGAVSCNLRGKNAAQNVITRLQDLEYLTSISTGRISQAWWGTLSIVSGGFGVFRRQVFDQVGGYDVHTGEDTDFTIKVRKYGWKVAFAPRSLCLTELPGSVWNLVRQRFRWDNCLINITVRKHKSLYNPFQAGFTWNNFLAGMDNWFFQGLLNLIIIIYPIYLYVIFQELVLVILVSVYLVYLGFALCQYLVALTISHQKREDLRLLPFIPLFPLYQNLFLRVVRLLAHLGEVFFRYTYRVPYIPPWVGQRTDQW